MFRRPPQVSEIPWMALTRRRSVVRNHQRPPERPRSGVVSGLWLVPGGSLSRPFVPQTCHTRSPCHVVETARQLLVQRREQMPVGVERRGDRAVSKPLGDRFRVRSSPDGQRPLFRRPLPGHLMARPWRPRRATGHGSAGSGPSAEVSPPVRPWPGWCARSRLIWLEGPTSRRSRCPRARIAYSPWSSPRSSRC